MSKPIRSTIIMSEIVQNTDRKFGADPEYYPAWVMTPQGPRAALFTAEAIDYAMETAVKNREDMPPQAKPDTIVSIFMRNLFG